MFYHPLVGMTYHINYKFPDNSKKPSDEFPNKIEASKNYVQECVHLSRGQYSQK